MSTPVLGGERRPAVVILRGGAPFGDVGAAPEPAIFRGFAARAGGPLARLGSPVVRLWLLSLAFAACRAPSPPPVTGRAAPPAWQVRALGGAQPIDPGTGPGIGPGTAIGARSAEDLLDADSCARCHAAIAEEWAGSRHALAWRNAIFQREYAARPLAWCVNCHAPLTTQQAGAFRDRGVDCASCHVRGGAIVDGHRRAGSPHATVVDPTFGSPAFCADCHQFPFPVLGAAGDVLRLTAHPMQTTVASFSAGPYAAQPGGCLACHGSRTDHAFPGGHDPAMLDSALDVAWCRRGDAIEVRVHNAAAGHHVPTGDIHRHMNLRVWRSSAPEALFEAYYGRRFDPADDGGKREVWDSTLAPGASRSHTIALGDLGGDPDEPVNLELNYVFIETELPRPERAPDEPAAAQIVRQRAAPDALPGCAPR